jgi:hypothetical protein
MINIEIVFNFSPEFGTDDGRDNVGGLFLK